MLQKKTKQIIDNLNNLIIVGKENIEIGKIYHEFFDENHEKRANAEKVSGGRGTISQCPKKKFTQHCHLSSQNLSPPPFSLPRSRQPARQIKN